MTRVLLFMSMIAAGAASAQEAAAPAEAAAETSGGEKADAELQEAGEATEEEVAEGSTGKTLQDRIRAVSRRVFLKRQRFELEPGFGFTTNDPFTRVYSVGARGSYHFNEELAIDVGGAYAPPFFVQNLQDIRLLGGDENDLDPARKGSSVMSAYVDGGVTFSPFYGKLALASEQVIHFDGFVSAGLGAIFDNSKDFVHPALEIGLGTRVFILRWLTVRADLRNYVYPLFANDELSFPNLLILSLGLGIHIPFDFDYSTEVIGAKG